MKFKTIVHEVNAISVGLIISYAGLDFKKLPIWIRKKYQDGKLFIGHGSVVVNDVFRCEIASQTDVILLNDKKELVVMDRKEFFNRYEDAIVPDNKTYV